LLSAPYIPLSASGGDSVFDVDDRLYRVYQFTTVGTSSFNVSSLGTTAGEVKYRVVVGGAGAPGSVPTAADQGTAGGSGVVSVR
jgi:hypothetical protein